MNFSTVPPCRVRTTLMSSKYCVISRLRTSGSRRSPRAVDPVTSQKTMLAIFRVSNPSAASSFVPQLWQNFAVAGLGSRQLGQVRTPLTVCHARWQFHQPPFDLGAISAEFGMALGRAVPHCEKEQNCVRRSERVICEQYG